MRLRFATALVLALVLAACAGTADQASQPVTFERAIGDTEQGLRMRLERTGSTVEIRAVADCRDGVTANLEEEVIRAEVSDSGSFETTHTAVHDLGDGDEGHLTATVEGQLSGDRAHGTIEARVRIWNGQAEAFMDRECVTGPVGFELRSGSGEWPAVDTIPVDDVSSIESSGGHAYAFGPLYPEAAPVNVTTIDPSGAVLGRADLAIHDFSFAEYLGAVAIRDGQLWSMTRPGPFDGEIGRHDLRTGETVVTLPANINGLISDGQHLWTLSYVAGDQPVFHLERRDLSTGDVTVSTVATAGRLATTAGRVWIVDEQTGRATAYDPQTLTVVETIGVPVDSMVDVDGSADALWIRGEGVVLRVDVVSGDVAEVRIEASDLAVLDDQAWIVQPRQRTVRVLDRRGVVVQTYDLPIAGTSIAISDPSAVWVAAFGEHTVARLAR